MPVAPAAPPLAPVRRIPFGRLGGTSALFARYAEGDEAALRFFAHDWRSPEALAAAARDAAALPRDRATLADVLAEQNAAWGNDGAAVMRHIDTLRQQDSAAVVTGQQLGLFAGPMYTVYKAITAVKLARQMTEDTGRLVVPVFWMAGEDHDWEEVREAVVVRGNDPATLALPPSESRQPVGRRTLGEETEGVLADLAEILRPTEFTPELLAALRAAYQPGATVREAFGRWMGHLFAGTGLVLMSSDDARLKQLAAPVFRQEIEAPTDTLAPLLDASGALEAAGFHRQVTPLPGNLFLMEPEGRFTLDPEGEGVFAVRGLDRRYTTRQLLDRLAEEPEAFSPNVVLRPIVEDHLLPTAAYVAGPGETAYYAQLRGVYEAFGVPMPVVYPRVSVTLVEAKVQRVLDRYDLSLADLSGEIEPVHRRLALAEGEHDVEAVFGEAARRLHEVANSLKPVAQAVDPTLAKSAEAARAAFQKELEALHTKVVRAEKRNHDQIREHLDKAHTGLFPLGRPQERALAPVYFLNKYGPDFITRLLDGLPLDTAEHVVVEV